MAVRMKSSKTNSASLDPSLRGLVLAPRPAQRVFREWLALESECVRILTFEIVSGSRRDGRRLRFVSRNAHCTDLFTLSWVTARGQALWGLGEHWTAMSLGLLRERPVRGGFREIKRSLGWHRPGRLDIAAVRRGRNAESRASHSRKPRRAGLVFTADATNH